MVIQNFRDVLIIKHELFVFKTWLLVHFKTSPKINLSFKIMKTQYFYNNVSIYKLFWNQWYCIFQYHRWTLLIKPRLLFFPHRLCFLTTFSFSQINSKPHHPPTNHNKTYLNFTLLNDKLCKLTIYNISWLHI